MQLDKAQICERIPHAGKMCLLDKLHSWDETQIRCSAKSHTDPTNPLRKNNKLSSITAIEYAGQTMALHGGLLDSIRYPESRPRKGYFASLREVVVSRDVLDDLGEELVIQAELLMGDKDSSLYSFSVTCSGDAIISGRAAVRLFEEIES